MSLVFAVAKRDVLRVPKVCSSQNLLSDHVSFGIYNLKH